ncbi:hypothetical protein CAL28_21895 [Bordetella genomosp. 11]|uniref:DUF4189 domain-containing protein n=2 Tax=Bordetella genomosp. 11 TaxID=1416808 RepID=A0A261UJ06_9BORD|nr:hypothetical protein CAL28_21895 [Bordetella genomosp. 11]
MPSECNDFIMTKRKKIPFIAFGLWLLLAAPLMAHAQCAPGIPGAGNPGCIPPSAPNSPYNQGGGASAPSPTPPPVWRDSWGAIAMDPNTAQSGTVIGLPDKQAATREALDQCRRNGGRACEILVSYYNQCAAVAQRPGGGPVSVARSADEKKAGDMAVKACGGKSACVVVYSACSDAVRVQ